MTHIKLSGMIIRITSLFLSFLFFSCISTNLAQRNFFNKNYFYNDSLKVAIDFGEDLEFSDVSFVKTKEYKEFLKLHKELSFKKSFLSVKSVKNELEITFFFNNVTDYKDGIVTQKILFRDSINNIMIFEKQKGSKKIIGFLKNYSKINSSDIAMQLASKISIDSVEKWQFSSRSIFRNYFEESYPNYLLARKKLDKQPFKNYGGDEWRFTLLATANSFISNNVVYDSIINTYEIDIKKKYNPVLLEMSDKEITCKNNLVFEKIAEIAKNNQVIMLNENHFYPNHRLFAMQMLDVLKQNGFTHISLEAFDPPVDSEINYFPNYEDGLYTREPYFAHFLRKAKELGFVVQGHESYNECIGREVGQAKNVYKILEDNPNAKIFVYVGFSHIEKENLNGSKRRMMASIFKEMSGINPITINQTSIHADNKENLLLLPRYCLNDSIKKESSADYFLVNNLRPNLKLIYPNTIFFKNKIKSKKFKVYRKGEVLVEIVDFKEYDLLNKLALPISSFLATPKNKKISLELPQGKYHIFVKTVDNKIIYDDNIIVN